MRLFIFGAGATIGTLDVPGVKGFGNQLAKTMPEWRTELPGLASVVDALAPAQRRTPNDWDLDAAWTHVDYMAKVGRALGTKFPGSASAELHAAVTHVYACPKALHDLRNAYDDTASTFTLKEELNSVAAGDVVVSFNWDTLVESLLCHRLAGKPLRVLQVPSPSVNGAVRFAKPHGSLTWNRHDLSMIHDGIGGPRLDGTPSWEEIVESEREPGNHSKCEPLLLGAVPIKSELIVEVETKQYQAIMDQWQEFCNALTQADEVRVLGYGFPPEDAHGRFLMREAVRRRQRRILRVDLYEVPEKFETVRAAAVEMLGVSPHDVAGRGRIVGPPVASCALPSR